jgi:hypothetical protein
MESEIKYDRIRIKVSILKGDIMKITYCDICGKSSNETVLATVMDGEHPHNGSTMYRDVDICVPCLKKVRLRIELELEDMKEIVNKS